MKPARETPHRIQRVAMAGTALLMCATTFAQPVPREPAAADGSVPVPNPPSSRTLATDPNAATVNQPNAADTGPLAPLAWLEGCWLGTVNQREFREHWLPLRGGILIGAGQSVLRGQMQDYQFLRLEPRTDGIHFTQFSGERKESSFRLAGTATDDKDTIFTFANTADAFPARLIYRRGTEGWLYETIEGPVNGSEKKVIYPLRHIDCESGELIYK